jgi:hypothetical protein
MLGLTWWRQTVRAWKGRKMSDIHPGYKRCNGCQDVKRLMDFHKRQASKDGRMPRCKVCRAIEQKKYRMRPEVAEHRSELQRLYYKRPGVRAWLNWGQRLRRQENPELFREKCRQWRLDHPDHARDYQRRRRSSSRRPGSVYKEVHRQRYLRNKTEQAS